MVTSCEQFQPYHKSEFIISESFKYLGKLFNFSMDNSVVKKVLIEMIENYYFGNRNAFG